MQAKIETLKAKNSLDEEYIVYPKTMIKCVINEHGENIEEKINDTILASEGKVFVDYGDREVTENYVPINADTLEGHHADYFATAKGLTDASTAANTYTDTAAAQALTDAKAYNDSAYANANAYTDTVIANLINGAPTTLDTLKEIADAMAENDEVVAALDAAIGRKANQAELDTHTGNGTIHITADERNAWNSKAPGDHIHTQLQGWVDTRDVATTPNDYNSTLKVAGLKSNGVLGLSDDSIYAGVIGFRSWMDPSGGEAHELAFSGNGNIYRRHGASDTWGGWRTMIDSHNIGSYALPITGGTLSSSGVNPFNVSSTAYNVYSYWKTPAGNMTGVGYYEGLSFLANERNFARIGLNDAGTPQYWTDSTGTAKYDLIHTGNIGSQSVNYANSAGSAGYASSAGSAPASDVYAWAKASSKPTYTYSEVGAAAASHTHNYAASSHSHSISEISGTVPVTISSSQPSSGLWVVP